MKRFLMIAVTLFCSASFAGGAATCSGKTCPPPFDGCGPCEIDYEIVDVVKEVGARCTDPKEVMVGHGVQLVCAKFKLKCTCKPPEGIDPE